MKHQNCTVATLVALAPIVSYAQDDRPNVIIIYTDDHGTLSLYQGDSGEIIVSGLDTDADYIVYLAIKHHLIGLFAWQIFYISTKNYLLDMELN